VHHNNTSIIEELNAPRKQKFKSRNFSTSDTWSGLKELSTSILYERVNGNRATDGGKDGLMTSKMDEGDGRGMHTDGARHT